MKQHIVNKKILNITKEINDKTLKLVPISSNKTFKSHFPRELLVTAVRRRTDPIRDMVLNLDLPIKKDVSFKFKKGWINSGHLHNVRFFDHRAPSMENIYSYIQKLPKKGSKKTHKDRSPVTMIETIESIAKTSIQAGIGNCQEKSAVAFCLLLEFGIKTGIPIEWVGITNDNGGDHQFVIVNRDPNTNLNDLNSWNPDAIILDPWFGVCFRVGDMLDPEEAKCKEYIAFHQNDIALEAKSYVGAGHSDRWQEHRIEKNELINMSEYTPSDENQKEPIPWGIFNK